MRWQDASRAARVEMGSVDAVKDRVRDAGWETRFESIGRDVRYAARTLRKSPGFTGVAVLTLALGIGATTAIFSLLDAVIFKSLPVRNPEELVFIGGSRTRCFRPFKNTRTSLLTFWPRAASRRSTSRFRMAHVSERTCRSSQGRTFQRSASNRRLVACSWVTRIVRGVRIRSRLQAMRIGSADSGAMPACSVKRFASAVRPSRSSA